MSDIRLGCSPLTATIYAGRLNKEGYMWVGNKHDVTNEALSAVAQLIEQHGKTMQTKIKGKWYSLELVEVSDDK